MNIKSEDILELLKFIAKIKNQELKEKIVSELVLKLFKDGVDLKNIDIILGDINNMM